MSRNFADRSETEDRNKILHWLAPPDPRPPITGAREPGTNEWFLQGEIFRDWLAGVTPYVVLQGPVGCGKTILLKSIAEACRKRLEAEGDPGTAVPEILASRIITFFFSSTTNARFGLNDLLRYLVAQLSLRSIPRALLELYRRSTESFPPERPNDNEKLIDVLISVLDGLKSSQIRSATEVFVMLDGVDEISPLSQCRQITSFLNRIAALDKCNLRILITTRPLELTDPWRSLWSQHTIPAYRVAEDIETYVRRVVLQDLSHIAVESQAKIIAKLAGPTQTM